MCRRSIIGLIVFAVIFWMGCQGLRNDHSSSLSSPAQTSSGELLYVVDGSNVTTYAIEPSTLEPSAVGSPITLLPSSAALQQLVPSPDDHFLYALWSRQASEYLSTFATDASGIPQLPSLQTMNVSSLSQLEIHPSGRFAYALQLDSSNSFYTSTIFLFAVEPSGTLQPPQAQGIYGPSMMPTLLGGLSPNGSQLYLESDNGSGPQYWERAVNSQSGTLAADILLLQPPAKDSVVFGVNIIIDYENAMNCSWPRYVNVLPNTPAPPQALIQCGTAMLTACGTATDVQLDVSGNYVFLTDPDSRQVRVGRISLPTSKITDTGSFLPFTAQTPGFAFSPDGTLIYALLASDLQLHIYRFDPTRGILTEGSVSIPLPASAGFMPAFRR